MVRRGPSVHPSRVVRRVSELVSNCPGSFLIVLAVVFVVLVVVLVALEVVLEQVQLVASHYCYRCNKKTPKVVLSFGF